MLTSLKRLATVLISNWGSMMLACLQLYLMATLISIIVAHVLVIVNPHSALGARLVTPLVQGLATLDQHWKAVLILCAVPFLDPLARELLPRLRKIGGVEFDAVQIESEGVREKPVRPLDN